MLRPFLVNLQLWCNLPYNTKLMKERRTKLPTRIVLASGALIATAGIMTGCGNEQQAQPTRTPLDATSTVHTDSQNPVQKYFPEANRLPSEEIKLDTTTPTTIINLSEKQFDTEAANNLYGYMESLFVEGPARLGSFPTDNGTVDLYVGQRPNITERTHFLSDKNDIKPSWKSSINPATTVQFGGTKFDNGVAISFSSPQPGQPSLLSASSTFAVEACQSTMSARLTNTSGELIQDPTTQAFAQELWCNSLGMVMFAQMEGMDYQTYVGYRNTHPILGNSPLLFTEIQYNAIPSNIQVLK